MTAPGFATGGIVTPGTAYGVESDSPGCWVPTPPSAGPVVTLTMSDDPLSQQLLDLLREHVKASGRRVPKEWV